MPRMMKAAVVRAAVARLPEGAGLGLRRPLVHALLDERPPQVAFLELAPENWMGVGGQRGRDLRALTERYPFAAHGLSLSLGGPAPLDETFLRSLKNFLDTHSVQVYSEHLSWCADDGHLYDLMPIPHTTEAVEWTAARIRHAQDILERTIAIENVSTYAAPGSEMSEAEFVNGVLERADCHLLLDVNNIVVNSINHGYDARAFLRAMPSERVAYLHVAGHFVEADDLRIDTHGSDVPAAVWNLLQDAYEHCGTRPTLLERDFNIPPMTDLLKELDQILAAQARLAA